MRIKHLPPIIFSVFVLVGVFLSCDAWAIIINPSFETADATGATVAENWTSFSTGGGTIAERRDDSTDAADTDMWTGVAPAPGAPTTSLGTHAMQVNCAGGNTAGAYQDVHGISPRAQITFTADARSPNLAGAPGDGNAVMLIEFYNQGGTRIETFRSTNITTANTGAAFANFSVTGIAPPNTVYARLVLTTELDGGLGSGDVAFDNVTGQVSFASTPASVVPQPISLSSPINNVEAWKGKLITISTTVQNNTNVAIPAAELNVTVPHGLDIVRNSIQADNRIVVPGKKGINHTIPLRGALAAAEIRTITFQVLVTSGVTIGQVYDLVLAARNPLTGLVLSNAVRIPIRIIADALFDQGTVIGKVFDDQNENAVQDEGEDGIPNVRLATEDGIVVYTDKDGKYHIPGLEPNRHLIKVDGHSLPPKTKFVTEEKRLFRTTPGMLSKISFAVKLPPGQVPERYEKDLNVYISQYFDEIKPVLNVSMTPKDLKLGEGVFEIPPVFRIETNYGSIITDWRLQVRNEFGEVIWTGYGEGEPPSEVPWSGIGDNEKILEPGDYSYRLIAADKDAREDWTALQFFRVVSKSSGQAGTRMDQPFTDTGHFSIQKDGKRSIPLVRMGAVQVRGTVVKGRSLLINNRKIVPDAEGAFNEIVYIPYGKNNVVVASADDQGKTINYSKEIELKDRYFFLVGLGEGELGYNVVKGSTETLGESDMFRDAFYNKGRVAFYIKGKIKGKFLVTAHGDTDNSNADRNLSRLFTNLDPDAYYPVYGDSSLIDYSARDTQEPFYILVEADRSFFKYGTIHTDFKDAELAQYNRTLSGAKVHYETLSTTKYGDPKAGVTVMSANSRQAADHNEFFATGGSIYYLRRRLVIEGSEKIKVEVRDKIQNVPIYTKDLTEGEDYEIDYQAGRIILTRPLSSVTWTDTIINNEILNGNKLVLIVDYEYETRSSFDFNSRGVRGWTHAGEHIKVGGTWIRQTALAVADDYIVRGLDGTLRLGENTRLIAEMANASNFEGGAAVSTNGGLSFIDNQTGKRIGATAWSLKGETKIGKRTEVSGYVRNINPGFSVVDLASQAGRKKFGINVKYNITDHLYARLRHDHLGTRAPNSLGAQQVFFEPESGTTTSLQGVYAKDKWDAITEYRHQSFKTTSRFLAVDTILNHRVFNNALGLKIGYQALEWIKPFVRAQVSQGGESNNQFGFGTEVRLPDNKTIARFEETLSNIGDGTQIGVEREVNDRTRVYSNIGTVREPNHKQSYQTTFGTSHIVDDRSRIYTEKRYTDNRSTDINQQNLLGYDLELADRWNLNATFERGAIDVLQSPSELHAGSVTVAYNDHQKLQTALKTELRYDRTSVKRRQLLFQNQTQYKVNEDITLKSRLNTSKTRNLTRDTSEGYFTELNIGMAYRPVRHDRFSFLTRYTFLGDKGPDISYQGGTPLDQTSHTFAIEGAYELTRYLQMVQKIAVRSAKFSLASGQDNTVDTYLWAPRLNFHVSKKWDIGAEYRMLFQENAADDQRGGFLFEVDRLLMDYMRLGVGYDFSHFKDGITPESGFEYHGFFVRLTGEF